MSIVNEPTMVGLTDRAHALLKQMKEDNYLAEMADGFRLGIGLALANGIDPPEVPGLRTTFSVATIDPEQELTTAIRALIDLQGGSVYRMAERLADWGIHEMAKRFDGGPLDIPSLVPSHK